MPKRGLANKPISQDTLKSIIKQIIYSSLNQVFHSHILQRGRRLFESGAVISIQRDGLAYEAVVVGSYNYDVFLLFDPDVSTIETECSCPYHTGCKHAAAVTLAILHGSKVIEESDLEARQKEEALQNAFGRENTGNFRILPIPTPFVLGEVIGFLSTYNKRQLYVNSLHLYLKAGNILEMHAEHVDWMRHVEKESLSSISVKVENNCLYIKCNCCNIKTDKLCQHQTSVLSNLVVQSRMLDLLDGKISFDDIVDQFSTRLDMSPAGIMEHFDLKLSEDNIFLNAKSPNIILDTVALPGFDNLLEEEENRDPVQQVKRLEKQRLFGNAFAWSDENQLQLLAGKFPKSKKFLASHIKEVNDPFYFNEDQLLFYSIFKKWDETSDDPSLPLAHLKENVHILMDIINYSYEPDPYIYQKKIRKKDLQQFTFSNNFVTIETTVSQEAGLNAIAIICKIGEIILKPSEIEWYNDYFLISADVGYLFQHSQIAELLTILDSRDKLLLLKNEPTFAPFLSKLSNMGSIDVPEMKAVQLSGGQKQIHVREVNQFLIFEPTILYEGYRFSLYDALEKYVPEKKQRVVAEASVYTSFLEEVKSLHPTWDKHYVPQKYVYLHINDVLEDLWFLDFFEKARDHQIEIFGQENLSKLKFNQHRAVVQNHLSSGIDWLEAQVNIQFGDQSVPQNKWINAIKKNERYIQLGDGSFGVLPEEWIKKLKKLVSISDPKGEILKISKFRFNIIDQLFDQIDNEEVLNEIKQKKEALKNYSGNKKYRIPKDIQAELRDYQVLGYQWLKFLDDFDFGGCLADDMGLGKTLQVLTFLVDQKENKKGTSLVVIPRSLLFNWAAEIEKFTPQLTFLVHHGPNRDRSLQKVFKYDLIISTYDTVTRDIEEIQKNQFNYIVLDESQSIKNAQSQRYKAMRLLRSRNKLVMTGTPIENNTFDLYAQFSFLNPGFLGSQKKFKDHFSIPIDKFGDEGALNLLKNMIHPFLLRRTKEQVAKELPEKVESVLYCEMGNAQRKLYEAMREKIKKDIQNQVENKGISNAKFKILDGLLKLRQLCNAPELIDGTLPVNQRKAVKIETLMSQLEEELGNHKALIYSQFVTMLSIIRRQLDEKGISYAYLDGSTRDREAAVNEFMNNDNCHVFLLSLKAGNTGLNLTKADYVYLIDPWWNPAVETQAIDRTHRIGQDQNVFAYRMICKNTIEEKILDLQKKKKKLAKDLIQVDENVFKSLDKAELLALFD